MVRDAVMPPHLRGGVVFAVRHSGISLVGGAPGLDWDVDVGGEVEGPLHNMAKVGGRAIESW